MNSDNCICFSSETILTKDRFCLFFSMVDADFTVCVIEVPVEPPVGLDISVVHYSVLIFGCHQWINKLLPMLINLVCWWNLIQISAHYYSSTWHNVSWDFAANFCILRAQRHIGLHYFFYHIKDADDILVEWNHCFILPNCQILGTFYYFYY